MSMKERRKYVRIHESSQITYELLPGESMKEYATKDISQGGIKFLTREFIPKGSRLKIKLNLYKKFFSFEPSRLIIRNKFTNSTNISG